MARVVHFEIHADDPERAIRFYTGTLDWEFTRFETGGPMEYWLIRTGSSDEVGIDGGLLRRMAPQEGDSINSYVCTCGVADLDEAMERIVTAGGAQAHPKMSIPGVGWLAYALDTERNLFGLMQFDPAAA